MLDEFPFAIVTHLADRRGTVVFLATVDGEEIDIARYCPGDIAKRKKAAEAWRMNTALHNGRLVTTAEIAKRLALAEAGARADVEEALAEDAEDDGVNLLEAASHFDDGLIVELAWNSQGGDADFIVYDRQSQSITRHARVEVGDTYLIPPTCCQGIVTPGGDISGSILLPTEYDEAGIDETTLRAQIEAFIRRYVELSDDTTRLCVEFVLASWVFDAFNEICYLAFRTSDLGRGKSRALMTIGSLTYRPLFAGGGSTPAALLRLIDTFGGTLICDEFDLKRNSELTLAITQLVNLGFQRGTPLVKCDGEDNQPRPFKCYGVKMFALRGAFPDDASESRLLSVWMRQRTRPDVPISLPKREFDAEALRLRNKLLAWRFANLGEIVTNPDHADPRLEDRGNQLGASLYAVARTSEGRARVVNALLEQQQTIAADRSDSFAGEVLEVALTVASIGDTVRPRDVSAALNKRRAEEQNLDDVGNLPKNQRVNPWKVGRILAKDLELPRQPKDNQGARYLLAPGRVRELCARFGVDFRKTPQTQPTSLFTQNVTENRHSDARNGDCDVRDVRDVSGGIPPDDSDRAERQAIEAIEHEEERAS